MIQMSLPLARAHRNRQLFSNHFLEVRLRQTAIWSDVAAEADGLRRKLRVLLTSQEDVLTQANEAQTEERLIRPVLRELGWAFEVQPRSQRLGATQYPDYALFDEQSVADAAAALSDRRQVLKQAIAVLEAKRWQRGLDAPGAGGDVSPNRVPSTQIINYLYRTEQPWGILTNGVEWRLYFRDADFADTVYFAVDLPALLGDDPLPVGETGETISASEAFRYFYLFFRPQAFTKGPDGRRWLDLLRQSSVHYARAVEEALKPRAYRAVTALCRGFIAAEGKPAADVIGDEAAAAAILDNSLTLLFRLLFLLYAEARDLLPLRTNAAYRQKSLHNLRERAARVRDGGESLFPRGRDFWSDLQDLCAIVDGAEEWRDVGVPIYNGGLFDPEQHPFLGSHYVADPQLAEAIDLLSRAEDPETNALHFVDYEPLDVRHLGSIYEGLLEHNIRISVEPLKAERERGIVVRDPVPPGQLYLATESGERKATGSFYTPDYVVQYIVDRSLGPLVKGRAPDEILRLRVLDPAMGSGHFLVAATSYLARAAVSAVEESDQAVLGDFARLDPERLRRLVVERCIFGVDRNPRAVELAKLGLWLATVQKDKPLNFLDHHLRCGDSLLGARSDSLGTLPGRRGTEARREGDGQYSAFDSAFRQQVFKVLGFVHQIEQLPSDTLRHIQEKELLFEQADALLERFRDVGDLWSASLLGAPLNADQYDRALLALRASNADWLALRQEKWFGDTMKVAAPRRFFHWDVEFAEVFIDQHGNTRADAGFDAVIGNPPYVRMEQFTEIKDFLRHEYETYATRSDLYVYFMERSIDLLREGGEYGVIVSNKFLRANYGKALRKLIGRETAVREIVDLGGLPIFPEATVRPAIVRLRKTESDVPARFAALTELTGDDLVGRVEAAAISVPAATFREEHWTLADRSVTDLLERASANSEPLRVHVGGPVLRGIVSGLNEAFYIDGGTKAKLIEADSRSAELIKPLAVGNDIRHYHVRSSDRWLIYFPHGTDMNRYPAVLEHLSQYRERLERRATNASHAWYELQQPQQAYLPFFEGSKIIYPEISKDTRFAIVTQPLFVNNKCFLIPERDWYLLSILNSRLTFFVLSRTVAQLEGRSSEERYLELRAQYMEKLPIRRIEPTTPEPAKRELSGWLMSLYYRGLRRAGIEPELPNDIRELGTRLGGLEGIRSVTLIGSWARGDAKPDSDVDLLVVDAPNGDRARRYVEVRTHVGRHARAIDLLLLTPDEFERQQATPGSFVRTAVEEGIVLHGG